MDGQGKKRGTGPVTPGGMSEASFPVPNDDDGGMMPMPDDEDEGAANMDVSGLNDMSFTRDSVGGTGAGAAIGGLDDSADPAAAPRSDDDSDDAEQDKPKTKKRQAEGPKRRRTRRKVVIDNDETELDGEHIKNMLQDTSDIVLAHVPHPADWFGGDGNNDAHSMMSQSQDYMSLATQDDSFVTGLGTMPTQTQDSFDTMATHRGPAPGLAQEMGQDDRLLLDHLSFEELLARPALGDDGQLAPELLELYRNNMARVRGKPFPYAMRTDTANPQPDESEDEEEDVEVARLNQDQESKDDQDDDTAGAEAKDKTKVPTEVGAEDMEEGEFPQPEDDEDDGPMPVNDDDEEDGPMPMGDDDDAPPMPFDDVDEDGKRHAKSDDEDDVEDKFGLSTWGLVNDAKGGEDEEDEDDPRQAAGTELVSSSSKWHKHTVRVLQLLQRTMGDKDGDKDADGNVKPDHLNFGELSKNCSRRTAAGVFFEMLQLKTWDFVEVDQGEAYGDITVCNPFSLVECI